MKLERSILIERTKAGMARARASGKRIGRPPVTKKRILDMKADGASNRAVAKALGVSRASVIKVLREAA